jgi:hypothetical protein
MGGGPLVPVFSPARPCSDLCFLRDSFSCFPRTIAKDCRLDPLGFALECPILLWGLYHVK